jgi:hypothetical protein
MNARLAVVANVIEEAFGKHAAPFQSPIPPLPGRIGVNCWTELSSHCPLTLTEPEYMLSAA